MKCPLSSHLEPHSCGGWLNIWDECIEKECAWWYKENNTCSILTLAQGSTYLHAVLLAIEAKMPFSPKF